MINSDFFRLNRKERRAVYLLLPLLLCVSAMRILFTEQDENEISLQQWQDAKDLFNKNIVASQTEQQLLLINEMDSAGFVASGLSPKQARAVVQVRNQTAGFSNQDAVLNCVFFSEQWLEINLNRIDYSGAEVFAKYNLSQAAESDTFSSKGIEKYAPLASPKTYLSLDINLADSVQLEQLPGIGAAMAGRIIKYRKRLGGFMHPDQLLEVYGMKEDNYLKFKDLVRVEESHTPKFICINTCTKDELANHPYIQRRLANSIINIREQHGPYKSLEGLKFSVLMNDSIYELISPYLSLCAGSSTGDP